MEFRFVQTLQPIHMSRIGIVCQLGSIPYPGSSLLVMFACFYGAGGHGWEVGFPWALAMGCTGLHP